MSFFRAALTALALVAATPLFAADGILIDDAYVRFVPGAKSAAAFLTVQNTGAADDRIVSVTADIANKTELHTHIMAADGTMQMRPIEGGIAIPAGSTHALKRGGDHVMMMDLTTRPAEGAMVTITLTFEKAGEVTVEAPVDNQR